MTETESLDFALQSGRMGTWDIDLKTGKINCSKVHLDLWGVHPDEFTHERSQLQKKVHPEDLQEMRSLIDYAIENRSIYEFEYRIHPVPGVERWVFARGRCTFSLNSDEPVRFAGVVHDITEKKLKEKELANAIKARNDFFTIASHELKTPLTCMQLQIQVMQWQMKQISDEPYSTELLESLKKQEDHLLRISRIVDNILDDSKIAEGRLSLHYENFDLSVMAGKVIDQVKLTALLDNISIQLLAPEPVYGRWDLFRLEQVLLNLIMNAIRYGEKKPIRVEVSIKGSNAFLKVKDDGMGIKSEDHERIFQRFERANPEKEINGMGLGLFISKNIVTAHGGNIRLESESGKGSEFTVILPIK